MKQNSRVAVMGRNLYSLIKKHPSGVPADELESWWSDAKSIISHIQQDEYHDGITEGVRRQRINEPKLKFDHEKNLIKLQARTKPEALTMGIIFGMNRIPKATYSESKNSVTMILGADND